MVSTSSSILSYSLPDLGPSQPSFKVSFKIFKVPLKFLSFKVSKAKVWSCEAGY